MFTATEQLFASTPAGYVFVPLVLLVLVLIWARRK